MKIISHVSIIYTFKSISIRVHSSLLWLNHIIFSVLCLRNICLLLLIFIMYPYSCYACSIVYICKYCVCPHGAYGLLDVGIKVSIYPSVLYFKRCTLYKFIEMNSVLFMNKNVAYKHVQNAHITTWHKQYIGWRYVSVTGNNDIRSMGSKLRL